MSDTHNAESVTPEQVANLRLRLKRGDSLCLNKHTINVDDKSKWGRKKMWLTCGDATIEAREWGWVQLKAGDQQAWVARVMDRHRLDVAEQWVARLLPHSDGSAS